MESPWFIVKQCTWLTFLFILYCYSVGEYFALVIQLSLLKFSYKSKQGFFQVCKYFRFLKISGEHHNVSSYQLKSNSDLTSCRLFSSTGYIWTHKMEDRYFTYVNIHIKYIFVCLYLYVLYATTGEFLFLHTHVMKLHSNIPYLKIFCCPQKSIISKYVSIWKHNQVIKYMLTVKPLYLPVLVTEV